MAGSKATTTLKLDEAMKGRVKRLAEAQRRSPHWIMREAIAQYVEREEARESFRQEALESWRAYRETGRHVTAAELNDWLDSWGAEEEKDAPACHG